jgi:Putative serine esterase (DUF676)/Protein FAM135
MSIRGIIEIIIHFESFRNIDLYRPGLYYFDIQVVHITGTKTYNANPYIFHAENLARCGSIDEKSYKSKIFTIKFCDEEISVKEIAVFRLEIETEEYLKPDLTIVCSLMRSSSFSSLGSQLNLETFNKEVCVDIKIPDFQSGAHQFLPIVFNDAHSCVMNSTIHCIPMDFKIRVGPLKTLEDHTPTGFLRNGHQVPVNPSDILFPNLVVLSPETVVNVQNKYVKTLYYAYSGLLKIMNSIENFTKTSEKSFSTDSTDCVLDPGTKSSAEPLKIDKIEETNPLKVSEIIFSQIKIIAGRLHLLVYAFIDSLKNQPKDITRYFMLEYNELVRNKFGESIFNKFLKTNTFSLLGDEKTGKIHRKTAKKVRKSEYYRTLENFPIYIDSFFPSPEFHPILFLDIVSKTEKNSLDWDPTYITYVTSKSPNHLIVFVHGFQGNSFDLRLIRNQVALYFSNSILMCSHFNETHTEEDISQMGQRLADETSEYIKEWCLENSLKKVSFIGHSLGGLIIRAALPYLESLAPMLNLFMTFSSPHLGYMYHSSTVVSAGMWFLKKLKKSLSISQLTMTDSPDPEESFLVKLSLLPGLEWFKHIAFVSSYQDSYAPFESARVEVGQDAASDTKGQLYLKMANNLLSRISSTQIHRFDINFSMEKKNFDNVIGRAAHIHMLEDRTIIQMILTCCASFFS